MLKALFPVRPLARTRRTNVLTLIAVDLALLRCSVMSSIGGSPASALARSTRCHLLPVDGRFALPAIPDGLCACTLYLVFKEPEARPGSDGYAAPQRCILSLAEVPAFATRIGSFLGEPSKTTARSYPCQALFSLRNICPKHKAETTGNWLTRKGPAASGACSSQHWGPLGPARCVWQPPSELTNHRILGGGLSTAADQANQEVVPFTLSNHEDAAFDRVRLAAPAPSRQRPCGHST